MPLARLYEQHADDCARAADETDSPNHRALLLKLADQWRRDAQRLRQRPTRRRERATAKLALASDARARPTQRASAFNQ